MHKEGSYLFLTKCYWVDQVNVKGMGGACSTYRENINKCIRDFD